MKKPTKTILITGAAGFIGSHLADRFLQQGYKVIGVDDFSTGQPENIKPLAKQPLFNFFQIKVEDLTPSHLANHSIDVIAHLASPASPVDFDKIPEHIISVNTIGTRSLLNLARRFKSRFLFASTSEVYGDPLVHPQPETYWGNVNPQGIRSVYDEAKRLGETYTALYRRQYKLDARIVRIFNTYGPHMRLNDGRVITNFIKAVISGQPIPIYGDGRQTRSFCFVDDLVDGLTAFLTLDGLDGQTINLGSDQEISINQLFDVFVRILKKPLAKKHRPLIHPDDPKKRRPVLTKAKKLLNYQPKISLAEGLVKTLKYFKVI
ncbi:MAG: NAD-dependent epimerase/dehydratase family protein [bacterium]|nr:NAD-dependent epimerase/dehydratase family protein [bacterium]